MSSLAWLRFTAGQSATRGRRRSSRGHRLDRDGLQHGIAWRGGPGQGTCGHRAEAGRDNGNGDIFITPSGGRVSGPEIISNTGKVIWFHRIPAHELASDFRAQSYLGKPVLTWWQGPPNLGAVSGGADYIYNDRYQKIAEVKGGSGYSADGQEFLITPWNTALIIADTITTANLTSIGGPADQKIVDGIVQEIDISTGKVLFQWNAADHVPYKDSEQPRPASAATPWNWFYINAVHLDTHRDLLISARYTWAVYKVSLRTRKIIGYSAASTARSGSRPARPVPRQSGQDLRLPARPRGRRAQRVHAVRRRIGRQQQLRAPLQQGRYRPAGSGDQSSHTGEVGQATRGPAGHGTGERADHQERRPVR